MSSTTTDVLAAAIEQPEHRVADLGVRWTTGPLTAHQAEVLEAVAAYGGAGFAAARLGLSEQTVKNHLGAIHRRLGTRSTLQSFYVATRRGYLGRRP